MYKEILQLEYGKFSDWYLDGLECVSKHEYLSSMVFDFTTYDGDVDKLFVSKALEVCDAISNRTTFDYIKENLEWYLIMMNMPFFADQTSWGTSVRFAWWDDNEPIAGFPDEIDLSQLTKDMIEWISE